MVIMQNKDTFYSKTFLFVKYISGVNTNDILTAYISAIRALRVLDPTGVLLELVCEPVRRYLRYFIVYHSSNDFRYVSTLDKIL